MSTGFKYNDEDISEIASCDSDFTIYSRNITKFSLASKNYTSQTNLEFFDPASIAAQLKNPVGSNGQPFNFPEITFDYNYNDNPIKFLPKGLFPRPIKDWTPPDADTIVIQEDDPYINCIFIPEGNEMYLKYVSDKGIVRSSSSNFSPQDILPDSVNSKNICIFLQGGGGGGGCGDHFFSWGNQYYGGGGGGSGGFTSYIQSLTGYQKDTHSKPTANPLNTWMLFKANRGGGVRSWDETNKGNGSDGGTASCYQYYKISSNTSYSEIKANGGHGGHGGGDDTFRGGYGLGATEASINSYLSYMNLGRCSGNRGGTGDHLNNNDQNALEGNKLSDLELATNLFNYKISGKDGGLPKSPAISNIQNGTAGGGGGGSLFSEGNPASENHNPGRAGYGAGGGGGGVYYDPTTKQNVEMSASRGGKSFIAIFYEKS